MKYKFFIRLFICMNFSYLLANSDSQCCRKQIQCYECDSRYDLRCGDSFNLTKESGPTVHCNDYCVKLKHTIDGQMYYVRTCAESIKRIHIKKTEVCYTARNSGGYLCFCEQDLCNKSSLTRYNLNHSLVVKIFLLLIVCFLIS